MGCRRTSAVTLLLVVTLLVSLLAPHLPIACARHVVVLHANNGLNNRGNMDLAKEPSSASNDGSAAKKGLSGRKLGAGNKEEAVGATGATTTSAGPRLRTVEMRAAAKQGDAATEMYDMLRRDYGWKASRRRPINNGAEPLQEEP
ncbi:uncharacterized protein LOC133888409 [Phragmites australis]|uniref:uncharacterized protein LOC133888409 n=1 Tax=Phragmites australis TaxID=29695 RepID=UPI002D782325|nr:uncharacterized protein LOC133888409 [Phragmites australis]